ncbi:nitrous oxide reductase family maturation protein NosD [Phaeovulum sp.]|uniref:nitrous oxide reductase family maturation protein NosD n=1 Tax=Phaeovulum sp. TaxID=2934796 RepID=UPI0039E4E3DE
MRRFLTLICVLLLPSLGAAADIAVSPGKGGITSALALAEAGDRLILTPGTYEENLVLDRPVTLIGNGAVLQGTGVGSVITVTGPDVVVEGLIIQGSGSSHESIDSGVQLTKTAKRPIVRGNTLLGNLYGVDIHGAHDALVVGNMIRGRQDHRMNSRGNGVYVWNAPGAVVADNDIMWGRDGIFVNTSKNNIFRDNTFRDLRFAVHYMYANRSEVTGNVSLGNDLGYAIMFSDRVKLNGNVSVNDKEHGLMLNYATNSQVVGNLVRDGKNLCLFMYNAQKNLVQGNRFEGCQIGIHFTAGSERNQVTENAFIGNRTQVKYVSTQWVEWSANGIGNYWSDFAAYDLNGDGLADMPYRPNDSMDHILWSQPAAKLLLGSPAVQLVKWSQSAFPALLPGGVIDSHPMMRPVEIAVPEVAPPEKSADLG